MYSFEGAYKSSLTQSLGRKKLSKKDELLAAAQQNRLERELHRLRAKSAVIIQASFRSYYVRKQEFAQRRTEFENMLTILKKGPPTYGLVESVIRSINLFFKSEVDDMAMISVCSLAVKYQSEFQQFMFQGSDSNDWQTKRWLQIVCGVLERLSGTRENISMLLRVLEVYMDSELYKKYLEDGSERLAGLYQHLVANGYFRTMRLLCDHRIPDSLDKGTVAPTPLAASLLALICRPLAIPCTTENRLTILRYFGLDFMSRDYTPQISCYIMPCIRAASTISVTDIINAFTDEEARPRVQLNATLLHSLMGLVGDRVGKMEDRVLSQYLCLISRLLPSLTADAPLSDENDSVNMECEDDDSDNPTSLSQLRSDCIYVLNTPEHVSRLLRLAGADSSSLLRICQICHTLLSRLNQRVHSSRLMYSLAFNKDFISRLWTECHTVSEVNSAGNSVSLMQVLSRGQGDALYTSVQGSIHKLMSLLSAFCSLFYHSILTLHDDDFKPRAEHLDAQPSSSPFSRQELVQMVAMLRDACLGVVYLAIPDSKPVFDERRQFLENLGIKTNSAKRITKESYLRQRSEWVYLFTVMARLTKHLYIRDTRTNFCPSNHWLSNQVRVHSNDLRVLYQNHIDVFDNRPLSTHLDSRDEETEVNLSVTDSRRLVVLTELPFVVPFEERVQIFHNLLAADRVNFQTGFDGFDPMGHAAIKINIRRDFIYEDAFEKLSPENEESLKPKVKVQMLNASGLDEPGIDGGGIFREFLSELLKTGFDPNRGLFKLTASNDKLLYPNPEAPAVMENSEKHFFFLGRVLGKALYENMLVELPFAGFFLTKILGKADSDFHQLSSLDPTLYRNLLFVKNYSGDVTELGLDFSVVNEVLGMTSHVELKPGGEHIVVNNSNRIEYVHLMADYKLNKQIRQQCQSFTQGLENVLKLDWLRMFNHHELHILISGATSPIDVSDLKAHTLYSGSYTAESPAIETFWKVVYSFTASQRSALLKFVTSCSRPPLLGFKNLYPAFCIHHGGNEDRLPTASTCMNFLKLPEYPDEATMKSKLLYAIESGAGFELS
ncbi:ubiquitin-protein ligase E3C-like [Watersipora subatra]|uniref:ubiquitin-protein ligase E3C-like n=1 Tax=Watersipora subatra TaxID=2589382 RepID=UPI00355B5318